MTSSILRSAVSVIAFGAMLAGCANGVPSKENLSMVYTPTVSACRGGSPNDACVTADTNRCKALIDLANPGRDETTYMAIASGLGTIGGAALGYISAGITGTPLVNTTKIITGEAGGGAVGTIVGYSPILYRTSVESCVNSMGRDPKLTEQYFASASYRGGNATSLEELQNEAVAAQHR